jgi:hypothetical protein
MRSLVGAVLALAACSSSAAPVKAPPEPYLCAHLGYGALYAFMAHDQATDATIAAAQAAYDAGGGVEGAPAARHYLACAAAYRAIPDSFPELEHVLANARVCYDAAIVAYYNTQSLEREGRAAVTAALADEPRPALRAEVAEALAAQKECTAEP